MKVQKHWSAGDWMRNLLLAWLVAVTAEYLRLPPELRQLGGLGGLEAMHPGRVLLWAGAVLALLLALRRWSFLRNAERWSMGAVLWTLLWSSVRVSFSWGYFLICLLLSAMVLGFVLYGDETGGQMSENPPTGEKSSMDGSGRGRRMTKDPWKWAAAFLTLTFFLFVTAWTVSRVRSFSTPTYDFGLFSQMFHGMKTTGLPMTTLERDGLLSHFRVHMSPIYYLMLPFYALWPRPETLQILQAAVLASAVIPLWKLGRVHGLPDWQKLALCALLLLFPAFLGGVSYDLHENCFLAPLLLWLFYGLDSEDMRIALPAALLTLLVKEDAALYVAVIALWALCEAALARRPWRSRQILLPAGLFFGAVLWFLLVTGYLRTYGDGVMTYRYDNFMFGGSDSLLTVVEAVLLHPMKAVYECVKPEKWPYIAMTLLPLMGLPLLTRKYQRLLLLIPYVLVNLMPDYRYQHDVFFQYGFGSTACLFYLALVNLADLKPNWQRVTALVGGGLIALSCFQTVIFPRAKIYPERAVNQLEQNEQIRQMLDQIPAEAPVAASCYYTTYLSNRSILYDIQYSSKAHILDTDYVVLGEGGDVHSYAEDGIADKAELLTMLAENGYDILDRLPGVLTVYARK